MLQPQERRMSEPWERRKAFDFFCFPALNSSFYLILCLFSSGLIYINEEINDSNLNYLQLNTSIGSKNTQK